MFWPRVRLLALLVYAPIVLASCGSDSSGLGPSQNPTLSSTTTPSGTTMYAGDSLTISFVASDSTASRKIALLYTYVGVNGALTYDDSVDAHGASVVRRTVKLRIPDGPLASNDMSISIGVVPEVGATIQASSFIITVLDTVTH